MKNYRDEVIDSFKILGLVHFKNSKHGSIYTKPNVKEGIMVPRKVDTRKIADNLIRRAKRLEL